VDLRVTDTQRVHQEECLEVPTEETPYLKLTLASGSAIEDVTASAFDDIVVGNCRNNTLIGLDGNDIIDGRYGQIVDDRPTSSEELREGHVYDAETAGDPGNDVIRGGDGDDCLLAGAGNDHITGGSGDDIIYANAGRDVISAGAGDDRIRAGVGNDFVDGDSGNDYIWGNSDEQPLQAGSDHDYLRGGPGNDFIDGQDGNDRIWGDAGDDLLRGGRGYNIILGGYGRDIIQPGEGYDRILDGGFGGFSSRYLSNRPKRYGVRRGRSRERTIVVTSPRATVRLTRTPPLRRDR
jgi:Ca2+-binding RTX toxin-like protein